MQNSTLAPSLANECAAIAPLDPALLAQAREHINSLAKPLGSLGRLEEMACRLYAIQESAPLHARPARIYTIAGDHGVVAEGVAASSQAVTGLMVQTFLNGGAAINCLCDAAGVGLHVVDAGVAGAAFAPHEKLTCARIAEGTANMAHGPAMTHDQCAVALQLGINLAARSAKEGIRVIGTGEMGIGNTTSSSALFCACLGFSPREMTGIGAGVPQKGLAHKAFVIEQTLKANAKAVRSGDPVAVLAALGGFEIAALTGLIIGAATRRIAVAIDGFISTAAFVVAWKLAPLVQEYCFFCHGSAEAGHGLVLKTLGQKPFLNLGMRLGEGTGAALGMFLLEASACAYNKMALLASVTAGSSPIPAAPGCT